MDFNDYRNIIIYGGGELGKSMYYILKDEGIEISQVIDRNIEKEGKEFCEGIKYSSTIEPDYNNEKTLLIVALGRKYANDYEEIVKLYKKCKVVWNKTIILDIAKRRYRAQAEKWDFHYEEEIKKWVNNYSLEAKAHVSLVERTDLTNHRRKSSIDRIMNYKLPRGGLFIEVGCGALLNYTNTINGIEMKYVPVDLLSNIYNEALKTYYGDSNIIKFAISEHLTAFLEKESADLIIFENSLDHTINPLRSIIESYSVLKKGGILSLEHHSIESLLGYRGGIHNWDFLQIDGDFFIANERNNINISKLLSPVAEIDVYEIDMEHTPWKDIDLVVNIKKIRNIDDDIIEKYDGYKDIGVLISELFNEFNSFVMR